MNEIDGMGLLNIITNIEKEKNMKQAEARINLDHDNEALVEVEYTAS